MSKKKEVIEEEKTNVLQRFKGFCSGVKLESKRIHWTSKNDLVKYSAATLVFVFICSLFFYGVDALFALLHSLI